MQQIVINKCFGGFGLSYKAVMRYAELKGLKLYVYLDDITKKVYGDRAVVGNPEIIHHYTTKLPVNGIQLDEYYFGEQDIPRDDPTLIRVIKELGDDANGRYSKLAIVEIPDDID